MKKPALLLLFALAGCGFEPLYVQKVGDGSVFASDQYDTSILSEMSQVKIESINGRFGQMVRNHLLDSLTPSGAPAKPKYRLQAKAEAPITTRQAMREDIIATREKARYSVSYRMVDAEGEELFSGDSIAYASYDIMANPYSTTFAIKKAEQDAAKIVADDIALRIGAYFH